MDKIKSPEITPHLYGQLIFDTEPRVFNEEGIVSSINGAGKTRLSTCGRMKLDPYLTPLTKINFKRSKDSSISPKTIKLLEENMQKKLFDIGLDNIFWLWHQKYRQ